MSAVTSWVSAHREGMKIGFEDGRRYKWLREYAMVVLWIHLVFWRDDVG